MNTTTLLLSEPQAAEFLGVCARTVYGLRRSGQLAYRQVGARILYHPDDLAEYLASVRQPARHTQPVAAA